MIKSCTLQQLIVFTKWLSGASGERLKPEKALECRQIFIQKDLTGSFKVPLTSKHHLSISKPGQNECLGALDSITEIAKRRHRAVLNRQLKGSNLQD